MGIRQTFQLILYKWWLIAILALAGGVIGYVNVSQDKPMYVADTTLYIMNNTKKDTLTPDDISVSKQLVLQYTDIISSRAVTSVVVKQLAMENIDEKSLLSSVKVTNNKDSNILQISTTWPDPKVAADIANTVAKEFSSQVSLITKSNNISILDLAIVPKKPVSNYASFRISLGIIVGIIAAIGGIYFFEYFNTKPRTIDDIEKGLGLDVIGIVPEYKNK